VDVHLIPIENKVGKDGHSWNNHLDYVVKAAHLHYSELKFIDFEYIFFSVKV